MLRKRGITKMTSASASSSSPYLTTLYQKHFQYLQLAGVPKLSSSQHKGSSGRIAVIGGSEDYTGAPYLAGISALRTGADLVYILCPPIAAPVIKAYSPDLVVRPILAGSRADDIKLTIANCHGLVVGPGMGRHEDSDRLATLALQEATRRGIPCVVDADGIQLFVDLPKLLTRANNDDDPVEGRAQDITPGNSTTSSTVVLTPNINEMKKLFRAVGESEEDIVKIAEIISAVDQKEKDELMKSKHLQGEGNERDEGEERGGGNISVSTPQEEKEDEERKKYRNDTRLLYQALERVSKAMHVSIFLKGATDRFCVFPLTEQLEGEKKESFFQQGGGEKQIFYAGSQRRCGGQGDILSGILATFLTWRHLKLPVEDLFHCRQEVLVVEEKTVRRTTKEKFEEEKEKEKEGIHKKEETEKERNEATTWTENKIVVDDESKIVMSSLYAASCVMKRTQELAFQSPQLGRSYLASDLPSFIHFALDDVMNAEGLFLFGNSKV